MPRDGSSVAYSLDHHLGQIASNQSAIKPSTSNQSTSNQNVVNNVTSESDPEAEDGGSLVTTAPAHRRAVVDTRDIDVRDSTIKATQRLQEVYRLLEIHPIQYQVEPDLEAGDQFWRGRVNLESVRVTQPRIPAEVTASKIYPKKLVKEVLAEKTLGILLDAHSDRITGTKGVGGGSASAPAELYAG
jgi:hypothetical protein